jgi:hypothetical protein
VQTDTQTPRHPDYRRYSTPVIGCGHQIGVTNPLPVTIVDSLQAISAYQREIIPYIGRSIPMRLGMIVLAMGSLLNQS